MAQRLQRPQPLREALWQPLRQQAVRLRLRQVARRRIQDAPGLGHHAVLGPRHAQQPPGGRGGAPGVQDALLRAEPGPGAQTADRWVRRYVRGGSAQKLDWLVVEEIAQLDMALWADLACVGLNVKFLLLGDFRQPAVLDGRPISAPLEHSQLIRDLAGGHRHKLTENMRSNPGIFNFVKWLRVGEEAGSGAWNVSRLTEAVRRQVPQLRYARA